MFTNVNAMKSDARCTAKKMLIISDIHGCLEALFQPLLQSKLAIMSSTNRKHIQWNGHQETCVLIAGDITDRYGRHGSTGEMKHEELLIIAHIHYLNNTHDLYYNPITVVLGNHCYNNLIGYGISHTSQDCINHMEVEYSKDRILSSNAHEQHYDSKRCEFYFTKPTSSITGRQAFFLYHSLYNVHKMNKISEKIVKTGTIPYTLFFRDFVHCDVACYFPEFDALVVHGGLNTKHINDIDSMGKQKWCSYINKMALKAIVSHEDTEEIQTLLNDRTYASNKPCTQFPNNFSWYIVGHTEAVTPEHCNIIRADQRNNAYSQCREGLVCNIEPHFIILDKNGTTNFKGRKKSESMCIHDNSIYKFMCQICLPNSMWNSSHFFATDSTPTGVNIPPLKKRKLRFL